MKSHQRHEEHGIDLEKLQSVIQRNWIILLVIFLVINAIAYFTIRWTKPLYESESILRLDVKDDRNLLGIPNLTDENENVLAGEIELIRSKNFLSRVLESMDLSVGYYTAGDVLNDEKFRNSPIYASVDVVESHGYDVPIYIQIIDKNNYRASAGSRSDLDDSPVYAFDDLVEFGGVKFRLYLTRTFSESDLDFVHFFIPYSDRALLQFMESNLTVEPAKQVAKTIRISFKDNNPEKAQTMVNAIDTLYLKYTDRQKNQENEQKIQWLDKELEKIENQLSSYENYIEEFTIENRSSDLNEDLKRVLKMMNTLDSQRYELDSRISEMRRLQRTIETEEDRDILAASSMALPPYLQENVVELDELLIRRERLRLTYTESTMAIQRLNDGIANAKEGVLSQISGLIAQLENELVEVNNSKARLEQQFSALPGKSNEFNKNKRFYQLYEEFYLSLLQSKAQFEIARAGTNNDFVILSSANLPTIPISPNKLIIHGIGLVASLIATLLLIGIFYLADNKVNNLKELESATDVSVLGSIPRISSMNQSSLLVDRRPKSSVSEALRSIRTNLQFMIGQNQSPVISITSTVSGEGKTFLAVNLGAILSMTNKRVIILDLDMRRPRIHDAFENDNSEKGMSTVLIDQYDVKDCIRHTRLQNLDYIPSGPNPPNPSELLLSPKLDEMVASLREMYDFIVLDTPPVGVVTDGKILLQKSDLSVYVVRANYSRKTFLSVLNDLHKNPATSNMALVLNNANRSGAEKYGYGYYENRKTSNANVEQTT